MKAKKSTRPVNNLIVVSDLHMICRLGLYPTGYALRLDGGGFYTGSELQAVVWGWWTEFWGDWVPNVTRGEPYSVALNGDIVDGLDHHRNVTHISASPADQHALAVHVLKPIAAAAQKLYVIRGTESHAGPSGSFEESIARELGAARDATGAFSRWHVRLRVGHGLVDLAHHIGTTGSMAYETSAVHKELEQMYVDAARWGDEPPDVVVRSHRHTNCETRIRITKRQHNGKAAQGFATACTTAGWQLKTPFAHKVPGGRRSRPQFGGTLVRCGDEEIYTRHYVQSIQDTEIESA